MRAFPVLLMMLSVLSLIACSPANQKTEQISKQVEDKKVQVEDTWARATFAMAKAGALYFTIKNPLDKDIVLESVTVSGAIAQEAQLHDMEMNDGMMRMVQIVDGVKIPAEGMVEFRSGGKHIMLIGLVEPLEVGNSIELTLNFTGHESLVIEVPVKDGRV